MLIVAVLTAVGAALRLVIAQQSLFADELSTRFVLADRGLADMISVVHTDAEITPPLYFVASWLTTRIDFTPGLMRAPSLIAGIATIPLVYRLGLRTIGHRAGVVAAALTALSPFMIYYSTEARGYAVMMALLVGSSLCLLTAVERGGRRAWIGYAVCTCAAVYTHYTAVFLLAGQLAWALWLHPQARRPALLATAAAIVGFLPWLSGLRVDLDSPTTAILSALQPFTPGYVRSSLIHWGIGFPYLAPETRISVLPGIPAVIALTLAFVLAFAGVAAAARRGRFGRPSAAALLPFVLALATPVGEAAASAVSSNLLGARNLAASSPALAVCMAALLVAAGRRLWIPATALAVGAFAVGAITELGEDFHRPDYDGVVAFVDRAAGPSDVVVDGASLSPDGVPTALGVAFAGRRPLYPLGRFDVRYDPFRIIGYPPKTADVVRRATAGGRRVFLVKGNRTLANEVLAALPRGYRPVVSRSYRGLNRIQVTLYAPEPVR